MLDGDDIAGWETMDGVPAVPPAPMADDWLPGHRWVWARDRLAAFLAGGSAAARAQILDGRPIFEAEMRAAGAVAVDGRLPVRVVADRVLAGVAGG